MSPSINDILAKQGFYIGVTATPARLDPNNTFDNENEKCIDFPAHIGPLSSAGGGKYRDDAGRGITSLDDL